LSWCGRAKSALRAIERALRDNPDAAGYLVDRGRIQAELGDHAVSLADFDRALALYDTDDDAAAFRANALRYLGRLEDAKVAVKRALTLNSGNPRPD
jgi:tetratricopeptide (TPR) repeat protein